MLPRLPWPFVLDPSWPLSSLVALVTLRRRPRRALLALVLLACALGAAGAWWAGSALFP